MNTHPDHGQQGPEYIPEPPKKKSKLRYLIDKMGLGAFGISLLVHILFVLAAIFLFYKWIFPPQKPIDFLPGGGGGGGSGGETVKVQQQMRKTMMSSSSVSKRIASTSTTATFSLPDSSNDLQDPGLPMEMGSLEAGSGTGSGGGHGSGKGTGTGGGTGPGKGFGAGQLGIGALIPTIMRSRCTDNERLKMVKEAGGSDAVEQGVKKSLVWLKGKQNPNGSWGKDYPAAMTGLSLLCFLGHCETTVSDDYGPNIAKGITFLIDLSKKNGGKMTTRNDIHWVYEHAVATYALAEAYTFSKNLQFQIPELKETVESAATMIVRGQSAHGGWVYHYQVDSGKSDLSVAGWQLQALKATKASGVHVEGFDKCIDKALDWLSRDAHINDGRFAYSGGHVTPAMTAVGVLCLQQWGKGKSSPARKGVDLIKDGLETREKPNSKVKDPFSSLYDFKYGGGNADLYAWYYAVQVMRNEGGKEWEMTNKAILEDILTAQNDDGSFKAENSKNELVHIKPNHVAGSYEIYKHCLNTLMLEVYYRFLPATSSGSPGRPAGFDDLR